MVARLSELRSQLAHLTIKDPDDLPKGYPELLERLRKEKEELERRLGQKSSQFRSWRKRTSVGFRDVIEALPEDSALIAFLKYHTHQQESPTVAIRFGESGPAYYAALVVVKDQESQPKLVGLEEARRIEASVAAWRAQILVEPDVVEQEERWEAECRAAGEQLRTEIWDPLEEYVRNAKVVMVVPEGPVHLVSFAALPTKNERYLVEDGPVFDYLSAERDLVDVMNAESPRNRLLAFAAPWRGG